MLLCGGQPRWKAVHGRVLDPVLLAVEAAASVEPPGGDNLAPVILVAVLLALVVIYLVSRIAGEIAVRFGFPPVLGELVGGVLVGGSALGLLVFPEGPPSAETLPALAHASALMQLLQATAGLDEGSLVPVFASQAEIIEVLSEIGVIILLFEIGLESDLGGTVAGWPAGGGCSRYWGCCPLRGGEHWACSTFFMCPSSPAIFAGGSSDGNQHWHHRPRLGRAAKTHLPPKAR
jgi:Kef-type K+ transport system membrane component KefB